MQTSFVGLARRSLYDTWAALRVAQPKKQILRSTQASQPSQATRFSLTSPGSPPHQKISASFGPLSRPSLSTLGSPSGVRAWGSSDPCWSCHPWLKIAAPSASLPLCGKNERPKASFVPLPRPSPERTPSTHPNSAAFQSLRCKNQRFLRAASLTSHPKSPPPSPRYTVPPPGLSLIHI